VSPEPPAETWHENKRKNLRGNSGAETPEGEDEEEEEEEEERERER